LVAFALIFCVIQAQAYSNRFGLSANLLDYARLGTMNMDFRLMTELFSTCRDFLTGRFREEH
ncbi:MAG: hypothetical protein IIX10_02040, partial [Clostridia bacterium]|nr:hypothetical protein [Clostridia bacterium]